MRIAVILRERAAHLCYASLKGYRALLVERQVTGDWEKIHSTFNEAPISFGIYELIRKSGKLHLVFERAFQMSPIGSVN